MGAIASQITSLTIVYSTVYSDADQKKHQSSASLAFVRGIHRRPVNSPHKGPVTRKMFPFDDVIMCFQDMDTIDDQLRARIQVWVMQTSNVVATIIIICYSTPIFVAVLIPLVIIFAFMQVLVTSLMPLGIMASQLTGNSIIYLTACSHWRNHQKQPITDPLWRESTGGPWILLTESK